MISNGYSYESDCVSPPGQPVERLNAAGSRERRVTLHCKVGGRGT